MEFDKLLATGRHNKVYKMGDYAVKVFNKGYPKQDVLNEALIAARVEETGLNIPKIHEVKVIDGQWAIVMDCIEGKTLGRLIEENPGETDKYIKMMVELQQEMHKKECAFLGKLKDKMYSRINNLTVIDNTKKYELLTRLDGAPKHKKLCHGDFTTQNIILSDKDEKLYIIDWNHATLGNASADVARTYLWLCIYNKDIADIYMKEFCEQTKTDITYVQRWLPVVAAARLYYDIPEEKELISKWIDVVEYE